MDIVNKIFGYLTLATDKFFSIPTLLFRLIGIKKQVLRGWKTKITAIATMVLGFIEANDPGSIFEFICSLGIGAFCSDGIAIIILGYLIGWLRQISGAGSLAKEE